MNVELTLINGDKVLFYATPILDRYTVKDLECYIKNTQYFIDNGSEDFYGKKIPFSEKAIEFFNSRIKEFKKAINERLNNAY